MREQRRGGIHAYQQPRAPAAFFSLLSLSRVCFCPFELQGQDTGNIISQKTLLRSSLPVQASHGRKAKQDILQTTRRELEQ